MPPLSNLDSLGVSADVRFTVYGTKSSEPFVITESQPSGMLMHDETSNTPFVACYGGMLKASEQDMSASFILSTNQMSDAWVESSSKIGARSHLSDRLSSYFEVAGNRKVRIHCRNGHPGIFCEPITQSDPRWKNLSRIWISENTVYYPKNVSNGIVIQGMTCRASEPFLPHPVCDPLESNQFTSAVEESLSSSDLEMGEFKYLSPLS